MEEQALQEIATEAPPLPPPPPSPWMGPVQLKDCIEELLKFTLTSSLNGELDLGLSKDYVSQLLQHDPSTPFPSSADISFKLKEDEWTKLIMEEGSHLLCMLATVGFELHVQEPFFSQLKDGQKTVEGRCAARNYNRIVPGAFILFNKSLLLQVQDVHRYVSFHEMLEAESIQRVLPGVKTIEEGVQVYRNFYSEEKESSNGVIAICVTKSTSQLYNCMANIISGLSCGGIQRMLNMVHTVGTNLEKLPPPASTLISSCLAPHNPHVKGSRLTDGARALAKHVNRSSDKYWGNFWGSDSDKNRLALDIISHLIAHCCWLNMHTVPPHGVVLELRVAEGYGARWSEDGHKVNITFFWLAQFDVLKKRASYVHFSLWSTSHWRTVTVYEQFLCYRMILNTRAADWYLTCKKYGVTY